MNGARWQRRFNHYLKAMQSLTRAVSLAQQRPLSELEQQGLIQSFEFTHELAWNVLKDYLQEKGGLEVIGSKDASRLAFNRGLIDEGVVWMEMIKARNLTSHTYNETVAEEIAQAICHRFFPAFGLFAEDFSRRQVAEEG
ncbi:MAG: nucleotidyltransferase substrate binding protein [Magnetococcales bacterium]|nr:nucleotidyltransferase substrate binding protein [Magnetococcales bacterium]